MSRHHRSRSTIATSYRGRDYKIASGRANFLQTDPMGFNAGDANIYRYCFNNSINLWDPWGLQCDSYGDLNLGLVALGLYATGGMMFSKEGVAFYGGLGLGTPNPSISLTAAPGSLPKAGDSFGQLSSSAIFTFNKGKTGDGSPFFEVGAGSPGINLSTNTVFWSTKK